MLGRTMRRAGQQVTLSRSQEGRVHMPRVRVAAVQASYVLMDQQATLDKVAELTAKAAVQGAQLVVFPEVFVPGTPIWIDTRPIWDGDEDWFRLLAENAVVVPGPATERLAGLAREHGLWLVIGVEERERHGGTIYNTLLYFSPDGVLAERHRKLVPTGAERTVRGMGGRLGAAGRRYRVRPGRGPDLLGELHAAGQVPHVRAGRGPVAGAHAGAG
jgi:predicted amidohydrolase